ncbi:hypothetical protein EA94_01193 [Enterococcus faecalis]|nr:hypothetical protein EA94_01193 [Enterococcus faecalis]
MNEMDLSLILAIITLVGVMYSIKEKEIVLGLYSIGILLLVLLKIIYYLTIE